MNSRGVRLRPTEVADEWEKGKMDACECETLGKSTWSWILWRSKPGEDIWQINRLWHNTVEWIWCPRHHLYYCLPLSNLLSVKKKFTGPLYITQYGRSRRVTGGDPSWYEKSLIITQSNMGLDSLMLISFFFFFLNINFVLTRLRLFLHVEHFF